MVALVHPKIGRNGWRDKRHVLGDSLTFCRPLGVSGSLGPRRLEFAGRGRLIAASRSTSDRLSPMSCSRWSSRRISAHWSADWRGRGGRRGRAGTACGIFGRTAASRKPFRAGRQPKRASFWFGGGVPDQALESRHLSRNHARARGHARSGVRKAVAFTRGRWGDTRPRAATACLQSARPRVTSV
jgi:hypothetical protein